MDKAELQKVLDSHKKWLNGDPTGTRADLRGADLREAKIDNTILALTKIRLLSEAIDLAKQIFTEPWDCQSVAKTHNLYIVPGEDKAVIAFSLDLSGGFCFVHARREIWWWAWTCPDPETVTVLWKMEE
mgnify:CR=1 FL=1